MISAFKTFLISHMLDMFHILNSNEILIYKVTEEIKQLHYLAELWPDLAVPNLIFKSEFCVVEQEQGALDFTEEFSEV